MKWVGDFSRLESTTWRWVDQIFTSWNPLTSWLRHVEGLMRAAWVALVLLR
jgi:hypothetical protein